MCAILTAVCVVLVLAAILKIYAVSTEGVLRDEKSMQGKTVIVTGATCGIGLETAKELARRKARVIMACRDMAKARRVAADIISSTGNSNVCVEHLDLSSLSSVRKFAEKINATEKRLDVLIHNAAFAPPPGKRYLTEDNLEVQFATNHFGPFLLTHLLLDLLKKSAPSRIVVVSSVNHFIGTLDFENLNCEKYLRDPYWVYSSTKLANVLFTRELSKRLRGTNVTVNALHPGGVRTYITRNSQWFINYLIVPVVYFFLKTPKAGAQTTLYLAISDEVEDVSGKYFVDCREGWMNPVAKNEKLAAKLWEVSERLTGISTETN